MKQPNKSQLDSFIESKSEFIIDYEETLTLLLAENAVNLHYLPLEKRNQMISLFEDIDKVREFISSINQILVKDGIHSE
jgi:hypothetical protein